MVAAYLGKLRLFNRDVQLYLLSAVLAGFTVYGGMYTVLLNLYLVRLGYGTEFVGLINAVGGGAFAAFCMPAGALGTRWNSRTMMIVGTGLAAIGFGLLPLGEFRSSALQAGWLLSTCVLGWLGLALYFVNGIPFLMSTTGSEERAHALSVRTALAPLAGIAGSLVGGLLPEFFSRIIGVSLEHPAPYRCTLYFAASMLLQATLALVYTSESHSKQPPGQIVQAGTLGRATSAVPYGLIAMVALVGFLRCAGSGATSTFFNLYLDSDLHVSTAVLGAVTAAGKLAAVLAALALPFLWERWGHARGVLIGSLGTALSLIPMILIPHWGAAGFSFVSMGAIYLVSSVSWTILTQEMAGPKWQSAMSGTTNLAAELSRAAMSIGGGYAITALGYRGFFAIGTAVTTVGAIVFWALFGRKRVRPG